MTHKKINHRYTDPIVAKKSTVALVEPDQTTDQKVKLPGVNCKAKAFDYTMTSMAEAANKNPMMMSKTHKQTCCEHNIWILFFPEIKRHANPSPVVSNYKRNYSIKTLAEGFLAQNNERGKEFTYPDPNGEYVSLTTPARTVLTCLRTEHTALGIALKNEHFVATYFDETFYKTYLDLLRNDFPGCHPYDLLAFDQVVRPYIRDYQESLGLSVEDAYLARLILLTMLLLAALFGPRDYTYDILSATIRLQLNVRAKRLMETFENVGDVVTPTAEPSKLEYCLTRVTFTTDEPDETDWIFYTSAPSDGVSPSSPLVSFILNNLENVSLGNFKKVSCGDGTLKVPIPSREPLGTEDVHLTHNEQGWTIEDNESEGGLMVVRSNGDRFFLYKDKDHDTEENDSLLLKNGDVICLSPDWVTGHARRESHNFVIQQTTPFMPPV